MHYTIPGHVSFINLSRLDTHMSIFNEIVAGFIGFLVVVLSGGQADVAARGAVDAAATSSMTLEDRGFIEELRDSLVHLQARLQTSSDLSLNDDAEDRSREDENRGRDTEDEDARGDDGDDESEARGDDSDDEGDDDDDRGGSSVQVTVGSAGGSSAAGGTGSIVATFTMGEIAKHNTSVSCYTAINGSVYDLTKWIPQHPGGEAAIKGLCGVDGTAAFNGQHGGAAKQAQIMAGFKIGMLAK